MVKIILAVAYAMLCLVFVSAYLAAYVSPRTAWWLQLPAVALPALAIALVALTPVLLWAPLRGALWVHGVFLVMILIRFSPSPGFFLPVDDDEPVLRILTFNAKEVYPRVDSYLATKRLAAAHEPNIVALQGREIDYRRGHVESVAPPIEGFLADTGYVAVRPENYRWGNFLTPVLVRNAPASPTPRLIKKETIRQPGTDQRVITRAEFEWSGTRFAVYNFHLHSFTLKPWRWSPSIFMHLGFLRHLAVTIRDDFLIRTWQTEYIRKLLDAEPLPFIVCGDFNSTPHQWTYRHIAAGLTDVQSAGRLFPQATYHARYPLIRIDHILISSHWRVHRAFTTGRSFSDHFPLLADVSLRGG